MTSVDSDGDAVSVDYNSLTVQQLKQEFGKRRLAHKGLRLKAELVKTLMENDVTNKTELKQRQTASNTPDSNGDIDQNKPNGLDNIELRHKVRMKEKTEREGIVLWRRPWTTLQYFFIESSILLRNYVFRILKNRRVLLGALLGMLAVLGIIYLEGPHKKYFTSIQKQVMWCGYWVGLGILSSVGLGTGLHTFLLYLGPHIAAVTLAAFECMSVDFPEPPYPVDIICPEAGHEQTTMSLWTILSKVRLEAFMWGAGTALGELPPYFMARAARLSGQDIEDDEFEELEELIHEKEVHPDQLSYMEKVKLGVHQLVQRVGFVGILACASIPNPLFDLAGITCGHFLIPFWTFFGATLIGKAVIKMHIQKLFVIFMFSEHHVESLVSALKYIPFFGMSLQVPFKEYLEKQKNKLHVKPGTRIPASESWLSWIFEKVIIVMVIYFVLSIVNSLAQSYHKRLCKERHELQAKLHD